MKIIIGKTGFEPATPWSQTKCSTKLSYFPLYGAPERSRTPNLLIRSQTLYPIELRAQRKSMVPRAGLEPARRYTLRRILSPVRLPIPPPRHNFLHNGAEDGIRTRDPHLGKVVFYH